MQQMHVISAAANYSHGCLLCSWPIMALLETCSRSSQSLKRSFPRCKRDFQDPSCDISVLDIELQWAAYDVQGRLPQPFL